VESQRSTEGRDLSASSKFSGTTKLCSHSSTQLQKGLQDRIRTRRVRFVVI
jgi:hypothetical protein